MAHRLSCSAACEIFPDQGSNPCPLHWQADSEPLCHQGSPQSNLIDTIVPEGRQKSLPPFRDEEIEIHRSHVACVGHTARKGQDSALEREIFSFCPTVLPHRVNNF